jgi:gluconolactonase
MDGKYTFTEGPAVDGDGNVYFSDIPAEKIHKINAAGKVTVFREKSNHSNGLMVNAGWSRDRNRQPSTPERTRRHTL